MRKNKGKKYAFGIMAAWCLAVGAAALTGCGTKEVHNKITVESSVEETAAETIEIETEAPQTEAPETEAPDPDEQEPRVEKDGRIRSYLTGEMVPVSQGNRRPLAIMMSTAAVWHQPGRSRLRGTGGSHHEPVSGYYGGLR